MATRDNAPCPETTMGHYDRAEFSGRAGSGGVKHTVHLQFLYTPDKVCRDIVDNARLQKIFVVANDCWHRLLKLWGKRQCSHIPTVARFAARA